MGAHHTRDTSGVPQPRNDALHRSADVSAEPSAPPALPVPHVTGLRENATMPSELLIPLSRAMPHEKYQNEWRCIYDSAFDGKSFSRLVKLIAMAPTSSLIVIQERCEEESSKGRYFGGFNATPWKLLAQREKEGKTTAAARARAERLNMAPDVSSRPDDQLLQFFGNHDCFVFTSGDVRSDGAVDPEAVHTYTPRGNSNFMYLFDTHPDPDRIGIGMGGGKEGGGVGQYAWFVDRFLNAGYCSTRLCPTFSNPRLSSQQNFAVQRVWMFDVAPEEKEPVEDCDSDETKERGEKLGVKRSILFRSENQADKILLELHGAHSFDKGDYTREGEC